MRLRFGLEPSTEKDGAPKCSSRVAVAQLCVERHGKVVGQLQLASHLLRELFHFPLLITSYHCYFFSHKDVTDIWETDLTVL